MYISYTYSFSQLLSLIYFVGLPQFCERLKMVDAPCMKGVYKLANQANAISIKNN